MLVNWEGRSCKLNVACKDLKPCGTGKREEPIAETELLYWVASQLQAELMMIPSAFDSFQNHRQVDTELFEH